MVKTLTACNCTATAFYLLVPHDLPAKLTTMKPNFTLLVAVGLAVLLHICHAADHVNVVIIEEHKECPEKPEVAFRNWCRASGVMSDKYKCWVTLFNMCKDVKRFGELSICRHSETGDVRKCVEGQWTKPKNKTPEGKVRVKRWWWGGRRRRTVTHYQQVTDNPPSISCPASISTSAPYGKATARVTWSNPTASDDHSTPTVTRISGLSPGSQFSEGRHTIIYRATDSRSQSNQCQFSVTVTVRRCSSLPYFSNGRRSCTAGNVYGSRCSHSCNTGYRLHGQASATCQASRSWAPSFPSCQPVTCGNPGQVAGGKLVCPFGHVYPKQCQIQCNSGFNPTGATTVSCTASGTWGRIDPCADKEAPHFTNGCPPNQNLFSGPLRAPVAINWDDPAVTDNSGQPTTLTSVPAKRSALGPGSHTVNITATDVAGNKESCSMVVTVKARECSNFVPPSSGNVSCTADHVEGSVCTASCNYGYRIQGQATLTCLSTEQWDAAFPTCAAVVCPPPSVDSGRFSCPSGRQWPAVCTLTCQDGYKVTGPNDTRCQQDATWTPAGSCQDIQAPAFSNGCPDNMNVYAARLGQRTIVNWTAPAVTDNSDIVGNLTSDVQSGSAFPAGTTVVTYTATDQSGNANTCYTNVTVTVLKCEAQDLQPSQDNSSSPLQEECPDGYVHGAACTLSCAQGYRLQGKDNITCERDDSTHPPTMSWQWPGSISVKPQCKEDSCPPLSPPKNGALSCWLGDYGWHCYMTCNSDWDVRARFDGLLVCSNQDRLWRPDPVPQCIVPRRLPHQVKTMGDLLYFTGSCDKSIDQLQEKFMEIIRQSIYDTTCAALPTCAAENVEVTCGSLPSRGRRSADIDNRLMTKLRRARRRATNVPTSHYVHVMFHVSALYQEDTSSPEEAFQIFSAKAAQLSADLKSRARSGDLNVDGLIADESTVGYARLGADCPPGTVFRSTNDRFSCISVGMP